jgi:hypothetical protein
MPVAPNLPWTLGSSGGKTIFWADAKSRFVSGRIDDGEQLLSALAAGRPVILTTGTGVSEQKYSTGNSGYASAVAAFRTCITQMSADFVIPPARWQAETSGRSCSMQSQVDGAPGVSLNFGYSPKRGLIFSARADSTELSKGGKLEFTPPGVPQPWKVDSESFSSTDPAVSRLLDELRQRKQLPMTFTPLGGKPLKVRTTLNDLPLASAMFDACMTALKQPELPPQLQFTELRYVITVGDQACELTGTFQLQGNGLWLTLVSDGSKNLIKVTRRQLKAGIRINSLDLGGFGGSRDFKGQDATLELDHEAFASLRRDLVGEGRPFGITLADGAAYTGKFGGRFALVEAPMFDACARVKFDSAQ